MIPEWTKMRPTDNDGDSYKCVRCCALIAI